MSFFLRQKINGGLRDIVAEPSVFADEMDRTVYGMDCFGLARSAGVRGGA